MALCKEIKKDNGFNTTYHRILLVSIDCVNAETKANIAIASYVNESYRLKEKEGKCDNAIAYVNNYLIDVDIKNDDLNFTKLYNKIKELKEFENSVDR